MNILVHVCMAISGQYTQHVLVYIQHVSIFSFPWPCYVLNVVVWFVIKYSCYMFNDNLKSRQTDKIALKMLQNGTLPTLYISAIFSALRLILD